MIVSFWTDAVRRLTTSQIFWTLNQNFSIPRRDGRKHACIVMRTQPWRRRPKALRELTGAKHGLVMQLAMDQKFDRMHAEEEIEPCQTTRNNYSAPRGKNGCEEGQASQG